jgi:Zn-dependent protease with chaperone function
MLTRAGDGSTQRAGMIEEDVAKLKKRVLKDKLLFLLYFCAICFLLLVPMLLLMLFAFSLPGRIALLFSLAIFLIAVLLITRMGERMVTAVTDAVEIDPDQQRLLESMAEDVSIATGKPFPELLLIEDPGSCNMFSIKRGKRAAIFLTWGMLEHLDDDQLRSALAHEMAHIYQGDATVNNLAISFMAFTRRRWFSRPADSSANRYILTDLLPTVLFIAALLVSLWFVEYFYIFLAAVIIPIYLIYGFSFSYPLLLPAISRNRDFMADELAAKMTLQPEELISAMRKADICDRDDALSFLQWMTFVPAAEREGWRYRRLPGVEQRIDNLERAFRIQEEA